MTRKNLMPFVLIAALAVQPVFAGSDNQPSQHVGHDDNMRDDHLSTSGNLRLLHGWTRATGDDTALIFVEIENAGTKPATLIGGASDIAQAAALVGFINVDGSPAYQVLPSLPIASGSEMVLAPQGVALRLDGLSRDLIEGESFDVVLFFAEADVVLTVKVEARNASQHSHAGHAH